MKNGSVVLLVGSPHEPNMGLFKMRTCGSDFCYVNGFSNHTSKYLTKKLKGLKVRGRKKRNV